MNVTEPRVGGKTLIIVPELCNPSTDEYHKWYRFPHNPLYVASYLRATGVDVDMLNLNHCGNQELQKVLTSHESPSTLLGIEFPSDKNKLYPYPTVQDVQHAQKYFDALPENVFSIGRAGTYRYMDIDDIIAQCLKLDQNM